MSQIYKSLTSGPVPPTVPTQFTADDATIAIPSGNNLNVFSRDTLTNNTNGIATTVSPNSSDNLYIQLTNRTSVTTTTSDAGGQTVVINIFIPVSASAITFVVSVTGYDATNNLATGGQLVGTARTSSGGAVVIVGTNDTFFTSDPALINCDWDIITDGTHIQASFSGVAGHTIDWIETFIYDQVQ